MPSAAAGLKREREKLKGKGGYLTNDCCMGTIDDRLKSVFIFSYSPGPYVRHVQVITVKGEPVCTRRKGKEERDPKTNVNKMKVTGK